MAVNCSNCVFSLVLKVSNKDFMHGSSLGRWKGDPVLSPHRFMMETIPLGPKALAVSSSKFISASHWSFKVWLD